MFTFRNFVLWLHLAGIVVWAGGMLFNFLLILPGLKKSDAFIPEFARFAENAFQRYRSFSREIIALIFLTGIFNLINAGYGIGFNFSAAYIIVLLLKTALFSALIIIQLLFGSRLLPGLISPADVDREPVQSPETLIRFRRKVIISFILFVFLSMAAIFLGLGLRYM